MMKILPQKVPPQIANINTNSNILANKTWVPHDKRPWLANIQGKTMRKLVLLTGYV